MIGRCVACRRWLFFWRVCSRCLRRAGLLAIALWFVALALAGCGSITQVAGDGGADQAADRRAPASDTSAENPSDAGAGELDAGPEVAPPLPACAGTLQPPLEACEASPGCARCLGVDFAPLARAGEPCRVSAAVCVADCRDCP